MGKKNKNKQQVVEDAEEAGGMPLPAAAEEQAQEPEAANEEDGGFDESIRTTADNIDLKKKNTRKKKNKGGGQLIDDDDDEEKEAAALAAKNAQADMLAAFADSDDDGQERKGKNKKKDRREKGGKKGKKNQQDDEEEEEKVEEPAAAEEELKESEKPTVADEDDAEEEKAEYPLNVAYCPKCSVPPEYCSFVVKDLTECKKWLQDTHPVLFTKLYGEVAEGEEEEKKDGEAKPKQQKKVKFGKNAGEVHVYKLKRGKKTNCLISGMEYYCKDIKTLAGKFGKKFSCGCAVAQDEIYGEVISIQGDCEDRLMELMETDKDLTALNIPPEKMIFEDKGNKKGRKMK